MLSDDQLLSWGWRLPFLLSFVLMIFAVWLRLNLKESPVFEERPDVVDGVALSRDELESVTPVEANSPLCGGPRAHEHALRAAAPKMLEQRPADAVSLAARPDVRVSDQFHVTNALDTHHAEQRALVLVSPEPDAGIDLALQLA